MQVHVMFWLEHEIEGTLVTNQRIPQNIIFIV